MLNGIIYFIVILISCILGAIVGLGGGVFIRPIFDAIGYHSVANIAFLSSSAIVVMAIISTIKKMKDGMVLDIKKVLIISAGSIVGGMLGDLFLYYLRVTLETESDIQMMQTIATIVFLTASIGLVSKDKWNVKVKNKLFSFPIGIVLGATAIFLGIGGGPLNVPTMMIFFSVNRKDAAAYSIAIIFFSHVARLVTMGINEGYSYFDLSFLPFVITAAIIGGFIGAKMSLGLSEQKVKRLFQGTIGAIVLLNITNLIFLI